MAREDWQDREAERRRLAMRGGDRDDFGQADYSEDYGYDPRSRSGYRTDQDSPPRVHDDGKVAYPYDRDRGGVDGRPSADDRDYARRMDEGDHRPIGQPRSWMDRAGAFFSPGPRPPEMDTRQRRRGPSDRVLWAVIVERLEDERGLDLRGVEVVVEDAEVTLNGRVRHKADRRRIEDIADVEGIRHVQNNLRLHEHGHWTFL